MMLIALGKTYTMPACTLCAGEDPLTSVSTGTWSDCSVWDVGYCYPGSGGLYESVVISSGTNVSLDATYTITDLTIQSNSVLTLGNGKALIVRGNINNNGTILFGTNSKLYVTNGAATIDGSGSFINGSGGNQAEIYCNVDVNFPATASLTFLFDYGSGSFIKVASGVTVTNSGHLDVQCDIWAAAASSTWTNNTNSYLHAGRGLLVDAVGSSTIIGVLNASASGNTVEYHGTIDQYITVPSSSTYYNLSVSGTSIKYLTGNVVINGDLNIYSGTLNVGVGNYSIDLKGNWVNTGVFEEMSGTVTLSGGSKTVSSSGDEVFYNLTTNTTSATDIITMDCNVKVKDINDLNSTVFTMTKGIIDMGSNRLTLGSSTTYEGSLSYASGQIIGEFERYVASTGIQYIFPVGTSDWYRPAKPTINSFGGGGTEVGSLICRFVESTPGVLNPRPTVDNLTNVYNPFLEGYWEMTAANGINPIDYNLFLVGNGFTSFTINSTTRLFTRADAGSNWTAEGTHVNAVGTTAKRTGLSTMSAHYCLCDITNCSPPSTSVITGSIDECISTTDNPYSVVYTAGNTYVWELDPASSGTLHSQDDGTGGKSTILADWTGVGQATKIKVTERNTCTVGEPVTLDLSVHPIQPDEISGQSSVPIGETGIPYSVFDNGYTYHWSVAEGTASAATGTSITVDFPNSVGYSTITVYAEDLTYGCGNGANVSKNIRRYETIRSIKTGDWDQASTWDCNCIPQDNDNIIVEFGHTVTLKANEIINNITINGTLNGNGKTFFINGDLIVNGTLITSNGNLALDGINKYIGGIGGTINTGTKPVVVRYGNKIIQPTTDINIITKWVYLNLAGLSILNNGKVTITSDQSCLKGVSNNTWVNQAYSSLYLNSTISTVFDACMLTATSIGNVVSYNSGGAQSVIVPTSGTYYNLYAENAGSKTMAGNLDINGNISITGTAMLDISTSNYSVNIAGHLSRDATADFQQRSGVVTFDGAGDQIIGQNESFSSVIVNKSGGDVTIGGNCIITVALDMISGDIDCSSSLLFLGASSEGTLSHTSGTIIGEFKRYLSTSGTKLFPIGSASRHHEAQFTINGGAPSTPGFISMKYIEADPGNPNLNFPFADAGQNVLEQYSQGYWQVTPSSIVLSADYDISLQGGTDFNIPEPIIDATRVIFLKEGVNNWSVEGTHVDAVDSVCSRTGMTTLASGSVYRFGLGDTDCEVLIAPTITGNSDVCRLGNETYSVDPSTNPYVWTVTQGTITSGQGTNSIQVTWDNVASVSAKVEVYEDGVCMDSPPSSMTISIHSLTTEAVLGPNAVPEFTTKGPYSVQNPRTGYTYTWTISGGTTDPNPFSDDGNNKDTVYVSWGDDLLSPGSVTVSGAYGTCPAAPDVALPVTIKPVISSINGGGVWSNAANWDAGVPGVGNVARITAGNPIVLDGNVQISDLIIDATANLSNGGANTLTLTSSYTNDGTHDLNGQDLIFNSALDNTIDGSGVIDNLGTWQLNSSNQEVLATTDLTVNGNVAIASGIMVTNNGSITVSGDITGGDAASTWLQNSASAVLSVGGVLLSTGDLICNTSGNTVKYSGAGQSIKLPNPNIYQNISLLGSGTKVAPANLDINGNLVIGGSAVFDINNLDIALAGNWTNSSSAADAFTEGTGQVKFDGTTDQTISRTIGNTEETFYDIHVSKTTGTIPFEASSSIRITNYAYLQKGVLDADALGNVVVFNDNATVQSDIDGFIDGKVTKIGDDNFQFPIGDGTKWARIGMTSVSDVASQFSAQYFNTAPPDYTTFDPVNGVDINNVSEIEYWTLSKDAGTSTPNVTLYYESGTDSEIDDPSSASSDLMIAHWDGTDWDQLLPDVYSNTDPGYITKNSVTNFSPFIFASKSAGKNPLKAQLLPVELIWFTGELDAGVVNLKWATASEIDNDYFQIERTADGKSFKTVGIVKGMGNSAEMANYTFTDSNPAKGVSYYRLKQFDFDGKFQLSDLVPINNIDVKSPEVKLFPNPNEDGTLYLDVRGIEPGTELKVQVLDMFGRDVFVDVYDVLEQNFEVLIRLDVAAGMYLVIPEAEGYQFDAQKLMLK